MVSTIIDSDSSPFAQLCRAAMLVEFAIKATWALPTDHSAISKCPALVDQMCDFMFVVDREGSGDKQADYSWIGSQALARSAAFVLLDFFACPEKLSGQAGYVMSPGAKSEDEVCMTNRAMVMTKELAYQTHSLVQKLIPSMDTDELSSSYFSQISPHILDLVYSALATFYWFAAEEGNGAYQHHIYDMRQFLGSMGSRWRLANEYLGLVGYHDSNNRAEFLT
ncbi:hypothetical protein LTR84_001945 [Exophiala bonariae]|uniref:Uncharacterized protein n=1 Tax=Exophiala bonariae TaxID=1690606 RepID=A0AAV9NC20_9EURO|nr:hypothetical protein LTR84_001945 [Exophiala bonariae]